MKTERKNCERTMDGFMLLDKNERIPLGITLHLLGCPQCRNQVRMMTIAERVAAKPLSFSLPVSSETIKTAVAKENPQWLPELKPVSMRRWVVSGVLMILFMLVFGLCTSDGADENFLIAFYLVFAGAVCSYCALFIGTNMDFFIKKIQTLKGSSSLIF